MNIVEPYAKILNLPDRAAGIELLRKIEWCGRISHRSEEAQTETSWERFIPAVVMGHGDWSIVEHASVSVDMLVDRGITQERPMSEAVNHPAHYQTPSGLEAIDVIEAFELNFRLGSAVKYILRAGKKGDRLEDLRKAAWYLAREIKEG